MENDLLTQLSDAVAGQNWIAVAAIGLAIVIPLVLKALGKNVPFVDPILRVIVGWARGLKGPKAPAPAPEEQKGLAAVVEIKDAEKK